MQGYSKIFYTTVLFVMLGTHAYLAVPMPDTSFLPVLFLIASAAALVWGGLDQHRHKKRMSALFLMAAGVFPFIYYAQMYLTQKFLLQGDPIKIQVLSLHAMTIYNLMRIFLYVACTLILLLRLKSDLSSFYAKE